MRFLRYLLIIALVAVAVFHLKSHFLEFSRIPQLVKNANYFFLVASALTIIGQYFGDGWLSQILLKIAGFKINLKETIKIAAIDVFAAHILPIGEAGVFAAVTYFYKKIGVDNQGIIFLTVTWAIAANFVLILFLLISAAFLPRLPNVPIHLSDISQGIIIVILALIVIAALFRKFLWQLAKIKLIKFLLFREALAFAANYQTHLQVIIKNRGLVLKALLAAFIYYIGNIASLYFAFMALGQAPSIALTTFAYLASVIAAFVTLAPAGIGSMEATQIIIFNQFNVDPAQTLAAVILFRLVSFWLPIPTGALAYFSLKKYKSENR